MVVQYRQLVTPASLRFPFLCFIYSARRPFFPFQEQASEARNHSRKRHSPFLVRDFRGVANERKSHWTPRRGKSRCRAKACSCRAVVCQISPETRRRLVEGCLPLCRSPFLTFACRSRDFGRRTRRRGSCFDRFQASCLLFVSPSIFWTFKIDSKQEEEEARLACRWA